MKILYIVDVSISKETGVLAKIKNTASCWASKRHEVYLIEYLTGAVFRDNLKLISEPKLNNKLPNNRVRLLFASRQRAKNLEIAVRNLKPDLIYTREIIWTPSLRKALLSTKYIIEVNSIAINEIRQRSKLAAFYWRFASKQFFKDSSAIVSVTNELKDQLPIGNKPCIVIGNGIKINEYSDSIDSERNKKKRPGILFVGSPNQVWQGLDKIIKFAENNKSIDLHIVGTNGPNQKNIKFHGYQGNDYINKLCLEVHVGISTLALHRKGMQEACPLKSRLYMERGLPVIIAYDDPDIDITHPSILKIDNTENNVKNNEKLISEFIFNSFNDDSYRKKARMYAEKKLSNKNKEEERLMFFNHVIKGEQ